MTVSEAMDIVRALCGKPDVDPTLLRFAMDEGRREIERQGNFYWMAVKSENYLFNAENEYSITTAAGAGFDLTDYKLHRYIFIRENASDTTWVLLPVGSHASAIDIAATDAEDQPEAAAVDNETLFVYPTPDTQYNIMFFYWGWTTNKADITGTDELFTRWPMLIISAALAQLIPLLTKSKEDAQFWLGYRDDEIKKAKAFTNVRMGEQSDDGQISVSDAAKILQGAK